MKFLNRQLEMTRLDALLASGKAAFAAIWGRRRVGKTRLLTEWCRKHDGLYTVADISVPQVQRRYFAKALATVLPGFGESEYPDWQSLFNRLARDARLLRWRGPLVIDEFPYWVMGDASLPGILQNWIDEEVRSGGIVLVIAGSSQSMMQGMLLDRSAPLYGRARELMSLRPLPAGWIGEALDIEDPWQQVAAYSIWGGVPRYWELAEGFGSELDLAVDSLALDPLGALHKEPDRLLMEEAPPATSLRPLLDVIGNGAHRTSEIASRLGMPATSLSRSLARLVELGLIRREVPFGVDEKNSKRSLYILDDQFCRFWFRVVAPNRGLMAQGARELRLSVWHRHREHLFAQAWEELCRQYVGRNAEKLSHLAGSGRFWMPAKRWWRGNDPEWDVVSVSDDGKVTLLGEVKWSSKPFTKVDVERLGAEMMARKSPASVLGEARYTLFVPRLDHEDISNFQGLEVITARDIMSAMT